MTTLRQGSGQFIFKNPYFAYEGDYENGKKNGQGVLRMKNGTIIEVVL